MSNLRGKYLWYELLTTDPEAAVPFYTRVIGWGTEPWKGGGDMPYTLWTAGGKPVGGLMLLPEEAKAMGAPPHWLAYIGTPNVAETVEQAARLGGRALVPPMAIENVGSFAVIADPQGAVFAALQPASEEESPDFSQAGVFSWNELAAADHRSAFGFYEALFGWKKTAANDMGPMGIYQMFGLGEATLGGMFDKPAEMPGPPHWAHYVRVRDVGATVETVKRLGGQVVRGPMEVPGGTRIAQCLDPQGAFFAIHASPV